MKCGVFVQLDDAERFGVEDQTIYLFSSEQAARDWMVARMLHAGHLKRIEDGRLLLAETDEFVSADDAIEELQVCLNISGYFHCYPVIDFTDADRVCRDQQGEDLE